MGKAIVNPAALTESGELCLRRLIEVQGLMLPAAQLITAINTAVEAHVSRILQRLIELSELESNALGQAILEPQIDRMHSTWEERNKWLKSPFGISFAGTAFYQDFKIVIDARNAVVHGDGHLTRHQTKSTNSLAILRRRLLEILNATASDRLTFEANSGELAMQTARRFVSEFDRLVLDRFPQANTMT